MCCTLWSRILWTAVPISAISIRMKTPYPLQATAIPAMCECYRAHAISTEHLRSCQRGPSGRLSENRPHGRSLTEANHFPYDLGRGGRERNAVQLGTTALAGKPFDRHYPDRRRHNTG